MQTCIKINHQNGLETTITHWWKDGLVSGIIEYDSGFRQFSEDIKPHEMSISEFTMKYYGYEFTLTNPEEDILGILPHGSGIDADWHIEFKDGKLICRNSFHVMNDNGMYTHWVDFTLTIKLIDGKIDDFDIELAEDDEILQEYLDSLFADTFSMYHLWIKK